MEKQKKSLRQRIKQKNPLVDKWQEVLQKVYLERQALQLLRTRQP